MMETSVAPYEIQAPFSHRESASVSWSTTEIQKGVEMMQAETVIAGWNTDNPKGCRMPEPMNPKLADVLQKLRLMHCAEDKPSHECSGRLLIDRNGMTLQCPLCGDERSVYPITI
jgi:hypothetical protein